MNTSKPFFSRFLKISVLALFIFFIAGCAGTVDVGPCTTEDPAGFLSGFIHGCIVIITFIISLFREDVAIYAVHNSGPLYDLGFVLGASLIGFSGGRKSK